MFSTFHGLELGKRGLAVSQTSIATTGNNIANANTKGYSRQQVNTTASASLNIWTGGDVNPSQLGTGVSVDSITRVRDRFLDRQYRDQYSVLGEAGVKQETLDRLETIFNEPSNTGLRDSMDQLDAAWQDLANNPDSAAAQAVLKQRAMAFVDTVKAMNTSLENTKNDLNEQMSMVVGEANGYLAQIAELNASIQRNGKGSNDLLDKRDVLVEELAKIISIKTEEKPDGTYNINLKDGTSLVERGSHVKLDIDQASAETKLYGGQLAGIVKSVEIVEAYQKNLSQVVEGFAKASGLSEAGPASTTLFTKEGAAFAITVLEVNFDLQTFTIPEIKEVQQAKKPYLTLISELGAQSQAVTNSFANQEAVLLATESRRQSVTGVSLDEEMANLIKYQHSYSAAARLVTTADEMLDTIINRMGR